MFFIEWVSNSEILKQILNLGKIMSENQAKIDALAAQLAKAKAEILSQIEELQILIDEGETVDLTALTAAVQGIDDLNPDDESVTGTDTAPVDTDLAG